MNEHQAFVGFAHHTSACGTQMLSQWLHIRRGRKGRPTVSSHFGVHYVMSSTQCSFEMFTTLPILCIAAVAYLCTPYAGTRLYSALNCQVCQWVQVFSAVWCVWVNIFPSPVTVMSFCQRSGCLVPASLHTPVCWQPARLLVIWWVFLAVLRHHACWHEIFRRW